MPEKVGNDLIAQSVIVGPIDVKVGGGTITKQVQVREDVITGAFESPQPL